MKQVRSQLLTVFTTVIVVLFVISFAGGKNNFNLASFVPGISHSTDKASPNLKFGSADPDSSNGINGYKTLQSLNNALSDIAAKANPSVVTIFSEKEVEVNNPFANGPFAQFFGFRSPRGQQSQKQIQRGMGSGVIVSKDGYILTNNHVVNDADEVIVKIADRDTMKAKVIGTDPKTDLAVIKIDANNLPVMTLGSSKNLRVGEIVMAIGSPLSQGLAHTVTMGIVSAKGRSNLNLAEYEDFIQTDAAINPGNSGGALVNLKGELVGINSAIATQTGGYQGIGFSIPIDMAKGVMEQLIKTGKVTRGYLGVYMRDLTPLMAKAMELKSDKGVIVSQIVDDSPASRAGFKEGDVITGIDGKDIKDATHLKNLIAGTPPGTKLKVNIIRDNHEKTLTVVLDELPGDEMAASGNQSLSQMLGFKYSNVTPQNANKFGLDNDVQGVIITDVDARSSAYRNGLRPGDVILGVNRKPVHNVKDFENTVGKLKGGSAVMVKVLRKGVTLFFAFEL